jgi:hypothetical protein
MMHKASVHIDHERMKDVHCCIKCTHTPIYLEKERAYSEICGVVNARWQGYEVIAIPQMFTFLHDLAAFL